MKILIKVILYSTGFFAEKNRKYPGLGIFYPRKIQSQSHFCVNVKKNASLLLGINDIHIFHFINNKYLYIY